MAKTKNSIQISQVKNESSPDDSSTRLLHSTNTTTNGKVKKSRAAPRINRASVQASTSEITENNNETPYMKFKNRCVTDGKIKNLIHYVENEKMTLKEAGEKANMGTTAIYKYYGLYRDNPEHRIPTTGYDVRRGKSYYSYENIKALINSLVNDKLTIEEAAKKANMHKKTVLNYYTKYMLDPERKIPIRKTTSNRTPKQTYSQELIKKVIDYVDNEHLTVREAAKKLNMGESSAYRYYNKYNRDPEKKIPTPNQKPITPVTSDQVEKLISYIVDDKMSLRDAAKKSEMEYGPANGYYVKYLRDPKHEIPIPGKNNYCTSKRLKQEEIKKLIAYIVDDRMNATDAARKMGVAPDTARRYYRIYMNDPDKNIPISKKPSPGSRQSVTFDQIKNLIRHIVNDKMSIASAALKVKLDRNTASQYYRKYKDDPNHAIPVPRNGDQKIPTRDQIKKFLEHILDDDMTIIDAGRQAGLRHHAAYIYYKIYRNDPLRIELKPDVDEQARQLVEYVNDEKMTIKDASKKLNISYTAGTKLYNECKDGVEKRPLNNIDLYYENLKAVADVYKKHQKMNKK